MLRCFGFRLKPTTAPAKTASKYETLINSEQRWLENNHLASLVEILDTFRRTISLSPNKLLIKSLLNNEKMRHSMRKKAFCVAVMCLYANRWKLITFKNRILFHCCFLTRLSCDIFFVFLKMFFSSYFYYYYIYSFSVWEFVIQCKPLNVYG